MPLNNENVNISDIKLGIESINAGYIGHTIVYPNVREIVSAVFTDTSTLDAAGGTRYLRITGEIGATYNLTGYGAGSYILSSAVYDQPIVIDSNGSSPCYTGSNRTITTTLTPTNSTSIQGGAANISNSITQSGGSGITSFTPSITKTITNITRVTTTINGTLKWAPGAEFTVSFTAPADVTRVNYYMAEAFGTGTTFSYSGTQTVANTGGSTSFTATITSGTPDYVNANVYIYENSCYSANDQTTTDLYP